MALLDGVPGAGKTEVYFEAVAAALRAGRRVLVLLPEIALSAQWLGRFERRFGDRPGRLAFGADLERSAARTWRLIAEGAIDVVVGARSALFLPLTDLGLIVVDEEHDASFKQEERRPLPRPRHGAGPRAPRGLRRRSGLGHAVARVRGRRRHRRAADRRLGPAGVQVALPARHGGAAMPEVGLVDLRRDRPPRGGFLSPPCARRCIETSAEGAQSLLFLNRRGYAPLTLCRACGHRLACPNCSAWLVTHRLRGAAAVPSLRLCDAEPEHCPSCGAVGPADGLRPGRRTAGRGAGASCCPTARVAVMTSDTDRATPRRPQRWCEAMERHAVDVLIGTQIIAKGHHFPDLTLVGVVDADLGLGGGDLRAAERTFQLLYQVAGRAGREERPGRVLIQTHLPEHPVMQALAVGDKDRFLAVELEERRHRRHAALRPPRRPDRVGRRRPAGQGRGASHRPGGARTAMRRSSWARRPAPLALLRGRYRERLLVKATPELDLPAWLREWLKPIKLPGAVQLQVDVDPISFL